MIHLKRLDISNSLVTDDGLAALEPLTELRALRSMIPESPPVPGSSTWRG